MKQTGVSTALWRFALRSMVVTPLWVAGLAQAAPGEHIKAGAATITPDVDVGFEFRTNVTRAEADPQPGVNLRVAPGLTIDLANPGTDFSLAGEYELRKFFQPELTQHDRFNDFRLEALLDAGKQQALGLKLSENAVLRNLDVASGADAPFTTQLRNDLTGLVVARPGPVLDVGAGGAWTVDNYRLVGTNYATRNAVGPAWDVQWRFFPRTAIAVQGEYLINSWSETSLASSRFFRIAGGMRGRLTELVVLVAMLGYGSGAYEDDVKVAGIERLLAQLQLKYATGTGSSLSVGWVKDFEDSYFTHYLAYNRIFGRYDARFGSRLGLAAGLSAIPEVYRGTVERTDVRIEATLDGTYYAQDWASFTLGTWYNQRMSEDSTVEYFDVNVHLLSTFTY